MNPDLVDILVCPVCKSSFMLTVIRKEDGEILEGKLDCSKCGEVYAIEDSIPNLLPPTSKI